MSHQNVSSEIVIKRIFVIRGQKIMLSSDLAQLYGVTVKALNQAVKRNRNRFPGDFMFQLTVDELEMLQSQFVPANNKKGKRSRSQIVTLNDAKALRSQNVTLKRGQNIKYFPYAFTEQGIAMLSSVLKSERAIKVNIAIMRAFVKLREVLSTHKELAHKFNELEQRVGKHDKEIGLILQAIKELMTPPLEEPKPRIGFHP